MSEQLAIDFDPEGTAAALAAEAALDIAYAELVANQVTTVAEARTRGLRFDGDEDCLVTVRVCPACADWEANEWLIGNNHGIDRCYLEHQPDGSWATSGRAYGRDWCVALDLTSKHVAGDCHLSADQTAMLDRLRPDVRERFDREVSDVRRRIKTRR